MVGTASVVITDEKEKKPIYQFVPLKRSDVKIIHDDFDGYDAIFITHGHFDHIGSKKYFVNVEKERYCTKIPYNTLIKKGKSIIMRDLGVDYNENYLLECDLFMMPYQGKKSLLTPETHVNNKLKLKKYA